MVERLVKTTVDLEQAILRAGRSIVELVLPPAPAETSATWRPDAATGILAGALLSQTDRADAELDHMTALAWTAEWIDHVRHALDSLATPIPQVETFAGRRWWQ